MIIVQEHLFETVQGIGPRTVTRKDIGRAENKGVGMVLLPASKGCALRPKELSHINTYYQLSFLL